MMEKVVLDTNIIISAQITTTGNPSKIMDMVADGELQLFYSIAILKEYTRVLSYAKLKINAKDQRDAIADIRKNGIPIYPMPSTIPFTDESDRMFYDAALASGATLITGNMRHYPPEPFIMTPAEFLQHWR